MNLQEALDRLADLRDAREQAVAENLEATKQEDAELQIDPRLRARLDRKRAEALKYLSHQNASALGIDLDRQAHLAYTIEETASWTKRTEKRAKQVDPGFTDYNQLAARKYRRKLDSLNPAQLAHQTVEEGKERVVADLVGDERRRAAFSRRRRFDEHQDVTYINQRNYRFNQKLDRAYDQYTQELRENLERGTAI